ncbi:MAG: outer membrane lipoprotein-sorting protein [Capsulimonadaceae bacterium]|nr:outer membrane lipoprotein-sorting protein [Capsulimonadaceae bacterium]
MTAIRIASICWLAAILLPVVVGAGAGASSSVAPVHAPKPPDAFALYRKSVDAADGCSFAGHQYVTTWSDDGRSSTVVARVYHQAPDQFFLRFLAPRTRAGRVILENKANQWTFVPSPKTVIHTAKSTAAREDVNPDLLRAHYSFTIGAKRDRIAGRDAYVISLTSKIRKDRAIRYWIDPYTGIALRTERYHAGGNLAFVSYYSDINFHPKFAPSQFSPSQWTGAKVEQSRESPSNPEELGVQNISSNLNGELFAPPRIREYTLVGVTKMQEASRQTLHLHYSDGLSNLSLFETLKHNRRATHMAGSKPVRIGGQATGRLSERFNYCLLNWDSKNLSLTLLGDVSPETLLDLATALVPPGPHNAAAHSWRAP